jgi:hypothetical protein
VVDAVGKRSSRRPPGLDRTLAGGGTVFAVVLAVAGALLTWRHNVAYAWWKIGSIAWIAAIVGFVAAGLMLLLVGMGIVHLRRHHPAT